MTCSMSTQASEYEKSADPVLSPLPQGGGRDRIRTRAGLTGLCAPAGSRSDGAVDVRTTRRSRVQSCCPIPVLAKDQRSGCPASSPLRAPIRRPLLTHACLQ